MNEKEIESAEALEKEGEDVLTERSSLIASFSSLTIYTEEAYEGYDFVFLTKGKAIDFILTKEALEDYCNLTNIPFDFLLKCSKHLRQEIVREYHRKHSTICCKLELQDNKVLSITEDI